jgi:hypothetical protein
MTPEEEDIIRARQKSRALVTAGLLVAMVVLFYLITIVRIGSTT